MLVEDRVDQRRELNDDWICNFGGGRIDGCLNPIGVVPLPPNETVIDEDI